MSVFKMNLVKIKKDVDEHDYEFKIEEEDIEVRKNEDSDKVKCCYEIKDLNIVTEIPL